MVPVSSLADQSGKPTDPRYCWKAEIEFQRRSMAESNSQRHSKHPIPRCRISSDSWPSKQSLQSPVCIFHRTLPLRHHPNSWVHTEIDSIARLFECYSTDRKPSTRKEQYGRACPTIHLTVVALMQGAIGHCVTSNGVVALPHTSVEH